MSERSTTLTGTISILSFDERMSSAALVGPFVGDNAEFLAKHLEELAGDVVLECAHLGDLDTASATVLVTFQESRVSQGLRVFFRGIPLRCREQLLAQARRSKVRRARANHPTAGHISQPA